MVEQETHILITSHHVPGSSADSSVVTAHGLHDFVVSDSESLFYLNLKFQNGPPADVGRNGVTNEELLAMIIHRLKGFNTGEFSCRENSVAITKLEEALMWLQKRTLDRMKRGVEGTLKP